MGATRPTFKSSFPRNRESIWTMHMDSRVRGNDEQCDGGVAAFARYIETENMMCAFGVPGNMSHGDLSDGLLESPVDAVVAKGM